LASRKCNKLEKQNTKFILSNLALFTFVFENEYLLGLPDGSFSNQKSQFGNILEGLRLKNVHLFYGHLEYFIEIWDML
jgi:hypothetical protein